jgi:hypothetical protein
VKRQAVPCLQASRLRASLFNCGVQIDTPGPPDKTAPDDRLTDLCLAELAPSKGMKLSTFDTGINIHLSKS